VSTVDNPYSGVLSPRPGAVAASARSISYTVMDAIRTKEGSCCACLRTEKWRRRRRPSRWQGYHWHTVRLVER
jgi:hypothetical protein